MRVRSLRDHYDGSYRRAGEEFEYSGKLHEHIEKVRPGQPERQPERQEADGPEGKGPEGNEREGAGPAGE